ncbi:MAG: phosphate acyltransferase PlsX [Parachlamydia sp.]|nr:phosphate acyltransferase PlsX [Parachlamydia sp.]
MRIGVDLMGGDTSPDNLFDAVIQAMKVYDASFTFVVLATPDVIHRVKEKVPTPHTGAQVEFCFAQDVITMCDEPLAAVRRKKRASLIVGMRQFKKRRIDALVSVGNTGALIVAATLSLPLLPGIKRPALLATLPTEKGQVSVIDVGGSITCKAHHLVQFAHMGAAYQRCSQGIDRPRVGLLNIGVESQKGTQELRHAYQILAASQEEGREEGMIFSGNIEARAVLQGSVDVLVTDGFSGNVLLKSIEGASAFILQVLADRQQRTEGLKECLKELKAQFSTEEYPGAILCGVEGVVVKCHGNATSRAFFHGIQGAITLVQRQLIEQLKLLCLKQSFQQLPLKNSLQP